LADVLARIGSRPSNPQAHRTPALELEAHRRRKSEPSTGPRHRGRVKIQIPRCLPDGYGTRL
jgi:hypothetical protein